MDVLTTLVRVRKPEVDVAVADSVDEPLPFGLAEVDGEFHRVASTGETAGLASGQDLAVEHAVDHRVRHRPGGDTHLFGTELLRFEIVPVVASSQVGCELEVLRTADRGAERGPDAPVGQTLLPPNDRWRVV